LRPQEEVNGFYARPHSLSRDDFSNVVATFVIVRRKVEVAFEEYWTKRICRKAYDRFAGIEE
jgi:hypothetical protein